MTERAIQPCRDCGQPISTEAARPGETGKTVHVDTGRETCG